MFYITSIIEYSSFLWYKEHINLQEGGFSMAVIRKRLAMQIVQAVKDVCGHDINFIDPGGMIFASTDERRIGQFHEIGCEAARRGETIEVTVDGAYDGTQRGVNIPVHHNGEIIAVIGITGDPEAVRKFGVMAQKITALILREHELEEQSGNEKARMHHVIRALALGEHLNYAFYRSFLAEHGIDPSSERTVVVVRTGEVENLTALKSAVHRALRHTDVKLFTFCYPNEYILLLERGQIRPVTEALTMLSEQEPGALRIGVGSSEPLSKQARSYEAATIARRSLRSGEVIAFFDALDLEILLGTLPQDALERYLQKTVSSLSDTDRALLRAYFDADMSLKETAQALYLHKNTLQYRLDRIARETGYNPRVFSDATRLYLALKLEALPGK